MGLWVVAALLLLAGVTSRTLGTPAKGPQEGGVIREAGDPARATGVGAAPAIQDTAAAIQDTAAAIQDTAPAIQDTAPTRL
ncbi:MAG: hypothetical protein GWN48_06210, partial [Actinobacteria bacterium]|nr:hypothetical protein [Actinomycetota bacterium]